MVAANSLAETWRAGSSLLEAVTTWRAG